MAKEKTEVRNNSYTPSRISPILEMSDKIHEDYEKLKKAEEASEPQTKNTDKAPSK